MDEPLGGISRFFRELKRRNVYRVAVMYAVVAFVTLQAAELVFPATTLQGAYDVLVLIAFVGFPMALVLAWAFEMTPEGVRRTPAPEGEPAGGTGAGEGAAPGASGLAVRALVGLGLLAAAGAGVWYLTGGGGETEPRAGERSIAVLPFENMGGEESEQFTRGVHDGLLTRLSNISGLKVISRTSVMQFEDTRLPLPAIADSLGVKWVMEGGVQKMGDQIQVNAQLIDPRTDTHAWAEQYRRDLTAADLFALQSEITKKIAGSLEARLTPEEQRRVERRPTEDLEAYRLYVRGRNLLARRTVSSIEQARGYFERALEEDSTYALAWAGLADARALHAAYSASPGEIAAMLRAALPGAKEAARRALELDPDLAEAHTALGEVYFYEQVAGMARGNGPAALREFRRAVELKPSNAHAQQWLADLYSVLGRHERAVEHASLAVELNPRHAAARQVLAMALLARGKAEEAWEQLRRHPHRPPPVQEGIVLYQTRRWDELEKLSRERLSADDVPLEGPTGNWEFYLGRIAEVEGDTTAAREHYSAALVEGVPEIRGLVHAARADEDAAFEAWGEIDVWHRQLHFLRDNFPELMGPLRDDSRFRELMREANVAWGLHPDGSLPEGVDVSAEAGG